MEGSRATERASTSVRASGQSGRSRPRTPFSGRVTDGLSGIAIRGLALGLATLLGATSAQAGFQPVSAVVASVGSLTASDTPPDALFCNPDRTRFESEVSALSQRILDAATLEEARRIATRDSRRAHGVLGRASAFAPGSESIQLASARLEDFHAQVAMASSRGEIVGSVRSLMRTPRMDADIDIDVDGGGCDYSGGEVIAIVLGFILGIIPGLILLVLLC